MGFGSGIFLGGAASGLVVALLLRAFPMADPLPLANIILQDQGLVQNAAVVLPYLDVPVAVVLEAAHPAHDVAKAEYEAVGIAVVTKAPAPVVAESFDALVHQIEHQILAPSEAMTFELRAEVLAALRVAAQNTLAQRQTGAPKARP